MSDLNKRDKLILKKIDKLIIFVEKLKDSILNTSQDSNYFTSKNKNKNYYISQYDKLDDIVTDIQKLIIEKSLENENIELEEFLEGMFGSRDKRKRPSEQKNFDFPIDEIIRKMNNTKRQSPKFKKFNQSFDYEKDWNSKSTEGYGEEVLFSLDEKIIKIYYPDFDKENPKSYPPKARWVNYADKYPKDYVLELDSPWCFRSALQCYELPISSREFEFELKKMELIGKEAVNLFLQYCSTLNILVVEDIDIEHLREIVDDE